MFSRVSSQAGRAVSRNALRTSVSRSAVKSPRRTYVQPSGADRASVVEVPSSYEGEDHFTPRAGELAFPVRANEQSSLSVIGSDMLGFKLEASTREGSVGEKIRPIYLDMQVCVPQCGQKYG